MNNDTRPIGVFDSGVGGISVLAELVQLMPNEHFIYYGDSANAPYGTRPTQQVRELTLAAAEKLMSEYPVKALVTELVLHHLRLSGTCSQIQKKVRPKRLKRTR